MPGSPTEFLILAFDIGTSSTRTALFDFRAQRLAKTTFSEKYDVNYGADGRAELDPTTLLRAIIRSRHQSMRAYGSLPRRKRLPITIVGASAFWHGLLGLDRKLKPVTPVFTWADSRAIPAARKLRETFNEHQIQQETGCMLRATFWPAKLRWLRDSRPALFRRVNHWVSPSDWIFFKLFGELRSSPSMASGTGLFDLATGTWHKKLADACGIRVGSLPEISGRLTDRINDRVEQFVFAPLGDGAASNLGSGADQPLVAAINVGTSAAMRVIEHGGNSRLPYGLFRYVVHKRKTLIGGATSNAGNLRQWCLRELRLSQQSAPMEQVLSRKLAATDSLIILPFWVSERAPTWPEDQAGAIDGLTQATTAEEIARSCATATFYRIAAILEEIERSLGQRLRNIIVSGGILKSSAGLEILADSLGRDLQICVEPEASLRGAAVHALAQLDVQIPKLRAAKMVKHDPKLATMHQKRCKWQTELEKVLTVNR